MVQFFKFMSYDMIKILKSKKYDKVQYETLFCFSYCTSKCNKNKQPMARDWGLGKNKK